MSSLHPSFLIIGAGKSGTTSLHKYLDQHPDVFMCPIKETNFFELEGILDKTQADEEEVLKQYPQSVTSWKEYLQLFEGASQARAIGETSPMYLYGERAPWLIKKHLPHIKLIAVLREPTSRLYSRYLHLARDGRLHSPDFKDALNRNNSIWWTQNDLIREGFYYQHLSRYYALFPPEQIKVFLYDDFKKQPEKVIRDIFRFVGVDESFTPNMEIIYNLSGKPKSQLLNRLIGADGILIRSAKAVMPGVVSKIKKSRASLKLVQHLRRKNLARPVLSAELKERFYREVYAEEIEKLEQLLGRDLSHWKQADH